MDSDSVVLDDGTAAEEGSLEKETVPSNAETVPETKKDEAPPASPEISVTESETAANANAANAEKPQPAEEEMQPAAGAETVPETKKDEAPPASPEIDATGSEDIANAEKPQPAAGAEVLHTKKAHSKLIMYAAAAILVAIILFGFYNQLQYVAVSPNNLPQAGNARFYEGFVYNESHLIPSSCLVFSYDPTLFNINNRTAAQLGYLYDRQQYAAFSKEYSCLVVDYGYWCYTPNNICTYAKSDFILSTIANATYNQTGQTYSFYRVVGLNAS